MTLWFAQINAAEPAELEQLRRHIEDTEAGEHVRWLVVIRPFGPARFRRLLPGKGVTTVIEWLEDENGRRHPMAADPFRAPGFMPSLGYAPAPLLTRRFGTLVGVDHDHAYYEELE